MKKTRYTEDQIAFALRQVESGTPVSEVIRKKWASPSPPSIDGRNSSPAWAWSGSRACSSSRT